ncbi:MAG: HAD-IC family P-type ATPase, partial [Synechococcus sp. BS307-5m-G37]|nr:HAD-IC family P-type ATPase [Synechococcus sp. BS307-5m-G37]
MASWSPPMSQSPAHALSSEALIRSLGSHAEQGLSQLEARTRLLTHGSNTLQATQRTPAWRRFLQQFNSPLLITLLAVALIKIILGEATDALVISSVTLINAVIGFVQESRAESAIAALAQVLRSDVEVFRDGTLQNLPSDQLVPGDVIQLEAGQRVPADLRLLTQRNLEVDESMLTGESLPVRKGTEAVEPDTPLAERRPMAYAGTHVTAGEASALVIATGDDTEAGQISSSLQQRSQLTTPLTRQFIRFSHTLLKVVVVLAGLTLMVGLGRGKGLEEMVDGAIALAVGAIPEELPAIVTITLAIGVKRMARRQAIIRKLPAVETLGSTTVICSDKTGTLTQNRMTVKHLYAGGTLVAIGDLWPGNERGATCLQNLALEETLLAGLLCSNAWVDDGNALIGDPTETALLAAAHSLGMDQGAARDRYPRRDAIPFDSEQQFMATLHGRERILLKGSVEAVLARCSRQLNAEGQPEALNRTAIDTAVSTMAMNGARVLAFAIGKANPSQQQLRHQDVMANLDFIGLQGMQDPPRPEAIQAVATCLAAGIRVKLITGDHRETASAIARQIGIANSSDAIDGRQLAAMDAETIAEVVQRIDVFARIAPAQKLALVEALQGHGEVVAMTGDGVNDAPALRQADIGIAMGAAGTEVARDAADMLLTDDNFATIEAAVEEGRTVALNLHKTLAFVLPVSGGASMTILLGAALGTDLPVTALQVLWLNMVCSLTMSIALAFEPSSAELMKQPPRRPGQPLLSKNLIHRVLVVSAFNWTMVFGLFLWSEQHFSDLALARTMAVQALVLAHLVYLVCISHWRRSLGRWMELRWRHIVMEPAVPLGILATIVVQTL